MISSLCVVDVTCLGLSALLEILSTSYSSNKKEKLLTRSRLFVICLFISSLLLSLWAVTYWYPDHTTFFNAMETVKNCTSRYAFSPLYILHNVHH